MNPGADRSAGANNVTDVVAGMGSLDGGTNGTTVGTVTTAQGKCTCVSFLLTWPLCCFPFDFLHHVDWTGSHLWSSELLFSWF